MGVAVAVMGVVACRLSASFVFLVLPPRRFLPFKIMLPPFPDAPDLDGADRRRVDALAAVVREAGACVLSYFGRSGIGVRRKEDGSPVSEADLAADRLIARALHRLDPDIPVVSEESPEPRIAAAGSCAYVVDPLDGSRDFLRGDRGFTVNVALVCDGRPRLGAVYAPALDRLFVAASPTHGRQCEPQTSPSWRRLSARFPDPQGAIVVSSHSHPSPRLKALLATIATAGSLTVGSSIKLCLIAAGEADLYPRLGRTMHWDTAAGHAVLQAAGGDVATLEKRGSLIYHNPACESSRPSRPPRPAPNPAAQRGATPPAATGFGRANPPFIAHGRLHDEAVLETLRTAWRNLEDPA